MTEAKVCKEVNKLTTFWDTAKAVGLKYVSQTAVRMRYCTLTNSLLTLACVHGSPSPYDKSAYPLVDPFHIYLIEFEPEY